jgi:hypothetical protein
MHDGREFWTRRGVGDDLRGKRAVRALRRVVALIVAVGVGLTVLWVGQQALGRHFFEDREPADDNMLIFWFVAALAMGVLGIATVLTVTIYTLILDGPKGFRVLRRRESSTKVDRP